MSGPSPTVEEGASPAVLRRVRPFPFDRLERVARAQVEAGRVLLAHLPLVPPAALDRAAALLGGPLAVTLVEAYAFPVRDLFARLPGPPPPVLCRIAAPSGRHALLCLDAALAARAARRLLHLDHLDSPLGATGLALDEQRALADLLDPLCAPASARLDGFPLDDADVTPLFPDPFVLALDARVHAPPPVGAGWARLFLPDRLRLRPPLPAARAALLARAARLARARIALPMEIGRTRVTRREFAALEPGDVILFEEFGPRPPFGGPLLLRLGRGGLRAHLDGDGLTIVKGFEPGASIMEPPAPFSDDATSSEPRESGAASALLGELPVEIVCELGRVTVTGRELLELRPGAVIPVGRPLAGPVDLTVGGRVVARGELVDVEGEIGVRVTQTCD